MSTVDTLSRDLKGAGTTKLHFDVSTGLKRVLGRELITNDEVAIFEMVKNSFDAGATDVHLYFGDDRVVIADNGTGMNYDDLTSKWLFVAYSAKRNAQESFREKAADRHLAGSKGIGRFSSDRLGAELTLQTRPKGRSSTVHRLDVDWRRFEKDDLQRFEKIPVDYRETDDFEVPSALTKFASTLKNGTIIELRRLRHKWARKDLVNLKASLAKLINPFGAETDKFNIYLIVPAESDEDKRLKSEASKARKDLPSREVLNGRVGNFIFSELQAKTTFIVVEIADGHLNTTLTDRGEVVYKIREMNPYDRLGDSGFRCEIYYLNQSAKVTFARRVGVQSVNFGSVFLFRNDFRVYPVGETTDDWFGFDRRKQQGYSRFLGTREIIGRVDVFGSDEDFQEASSRNNGLIDTPAVRQLHKAVMEHGLKRLEKYVVPVSWPDKLEAEAGDLSRLMTDPGRARVSAAVANLIDNDDVELVNYSKRLISLINERSGEFESSLISLRAIAEKTGDKALRAKLDTAEKRFEELKSSESEARKVADKERAAAATATARAEKAEAEADVERRRSHFMEAFVNLDAATILNLHHQITIYAVDIGQQIENLLADTAGQKSIPREVLLKAMDQIAFLNRKIESITKFATKANFKLDSERIQANLPEFIAEYIQHVAKASGSARVRIDVTNDHGGMNMKFNPIDISIIVDNLISNARRAKASRVTFLLSPLGKNGMELKVRDNGNGLSRGADQRRIFEMGYTTTGGSGLGLYHVRQVLGEMGGSIEVEENEKGSGLTFLIKVSSSKGDK
jgi:signal transduction histidine kinase